MSRTLYVPSTALIGCFRLVILVLMLLSVSRLGAQQVTVSTLSQLTAAINGAQAGDTIVVTDGTYTTTGEISVLHKEGTATAPIVIMAENIGSAEITGRGSFNLKGRTCYVEIIGFYFTHVGLTGNYNSGEYCTFTRNVFECPENTSTNGASSSYLKIFGSHNTISYNTFRNKSYRGPILSIQPSAESGKGRFNHVHHNYFVNFPDEGLNDNSAIQPGYNAGRAGDANLIVEYNLFEGMNADAEGVMSVKANKVTFRYNTIRNSRDVSLRDGVRSEVYGNYFFGGRANGVRFADDHHLIYNNVFVGVPIGVKLFSRIDPDNPAVYSHARPDNCFVGFNTMIGCGKAFWHDGTGSSENLQLINNLFYDCDVAVDLDRAAWSNPVFKGNVHWNTPPGFVTDTSYTELDPEVTLDVFGVPHLTEMSPVRNIATGDYAFVNTDIDLDARPEAKDVGADQFTTLPSRNPPLTSNDVGPQANLPGSPQRLIIPGTFAAEDYSSGSGVRADTTTDGGGGRALTSILAGDWAGYEVSVQAASTYEVSYRVASADSSINLVIGVDGTPLGEVTSPPTGAAESWIDLKDTLVLPAGPRNLRLDFLAGGWRLNQLTFRVIAGIIPPVATFALPADTLTVEEGYDLELEVLASDEDGEVENVKLYRDGVLIRQESVTPYTWGHDGSPDPEELNGLAVGRYTFLAVATDDDNNTQRDSFVLNVVAMGTTSAEEPTALAPPLRLFPNPTGDELHLTGLPAPHTEVAIFDATGRNLGPLPQDRAEDRLRFDVSALQPGIYFLRIGVDGRYGKRQFVKR